MTTEELSKYVRERGMASLQPKIQNTAMIIADVYEEGFKDCFELLTGQRFDE